MTSYAAAVVAGAAVTVLHLTLSHQKLVEAARAAIEAQRALGVGMRFDGPLFASRERLLGGWAMVAAASLALAPLGIAALVGRPTTSLEGFMSGVVAAWLTVALYTPRVIASYVLAQARADGVTPARPISR